MNGADAEPEIWSNAPAALAPMIGALATPGAAAWARCVCAEGVANEYLGGAWFPSEPHENGSTRPIVNAM
jgi:hypothetical protein